MKPGWRKAFIAVLRASGNVALAARLAQVHRVYAYAERRRLPEFAAQWADAIEEAGDLLEAEAWRRAMIGTLKPVFYQGTECGKVREYSDTMLMLLLKGAKPEKYRQNVQVSGPRNEPDTLQVLTDVERLTRLMELAEAGKTGGNPSLLQPAAK